MNHQRDPDGNSPPFPSQEASRNRHRLFVAITTILIVIFLLGAGEVGCRLLVSPRHKFQWVFPTTDRNTLYEFDETLGWKPKKNRHEVFKGAVSIHVDSNSDGFRDIEHDLATKEKPRLMVLGDSFTWGYDVEVKDRFTDLLQEGIPEIEVFNCGVSGYSTAQELLLFRQFEKRYAPDVVLLIYSGNDRSGNTRPISGGGYSRPIFKLQDGDWVLSNVPLTRHTPFDPSSEHLSYRNRSHLWDSIRYLLYKTSLRLSRDRTDELVVELGKEVSDAGGTFVVAIQSSDTDLQKFLQDHGIESVMVDEYLDSAADPGTPIRFNSHGSHWTPYGHRLVANLLEPIIRNAFGLSTN